MLWRPSKLIEPCLPSPAKAPPSRPGWIHEIKHDGFRILARRDSADVRLITRAGNDFSSRFPFIAMGVGKLPVRFDVRFTPKSGHRGTPLGCVLSANQASLRLCLKMLLSCGWQERTPLAVQLALRVL